MHLKHSSFSKSGDNSLRVADVKIVEQSICTLNVGLGVLNLRRNYRSLKSDRSPQPYSQTS